MQQTVAGILSALDQLAALNQDEYPPSRPRPPATAENIERAERARERALPPQYVEFLRLHDGWPDFPWGVDLFGTEEHTTDVYAQYQDLLDRAEVSSDLRQALIVAADRQGPAMALMLETGEVVGLRYAQFERYADFASYLTAARDMVHAHLAGVLATRDSVEADWDPAHRAAKEVSLGAALASIGHTPSLAAAVPPASDPMPPALEPADLAVPGEASVRLSLVLYLGAYPSPAEVVDSFRAFRRHFPVDGPLRWALPSRFGVVAHTADGQDDESWAERLRVEDGLFGVRLSCAHHTLNVCGVPPTDEGARRASFCEVIVPVEADPSHLAGLAADLVEILPVRSGHGGFSVYASDPSGYRHSFAWCRRFFGLDVGYVDGFLESMTDRVLGAGWLTVLGPTFAGALGEPSVPGVAVDRRNGSLVLRAGDTPTLGDVRRGEFPTAMAEVERYLWPVKLDPQDYWWNPDTAELPGAFGEHRATGAWLNRLLNPAGWLDPTVRERGEELLAVHDPALVSRWHASGAGLTDLFEYLVEAGGQDLSTLELVTSHPYDAPDVAFGNLLDAYLARGDLAKATALLPAALERAPSYPRIFHTAARLAASSGDHARALELAVAAVEYGYDDLAALRADELLRALWDHPRFPR